MKTVTFLLVPIAVLSIYAFADTPENPVEAGTVTWMRDYEKATAESAKTGKPIFLLFQEIPGCAGCQEFGKNVMSHPQIVEAIESEFVPLLVPNNQPGKAAELVKKFNEPAWNYQVVRFLDAKGADLIPRKDKVWIAPHVAERMGEALEKAGRPVPKYLQALGSVGDLSNVHTAAFAMACFWTGEAKLGTIPGVITTEAGFFDNHEVTLVRYRGDKITLPELTRKAAAFDCANAVYVMKAEQIAALKKAGTRLKTGKLSVEGYRTAPKTDQKKQLSGKPAFTDLKMDPTQAMHVNSWIRKDSAKALEWLSPRQLAQMK